MENEYIGNLNKELRELDADKEKTKYELMSSQKRMSDLLLNELGSDIKDVINGKTIVKLSFKEKVKSFFLRIFNTLSPPTS